MVKLGILPSHKLLTSLFKHEVVELGNQAVALHHGDILHGRNNFAVCILPTRKRLGGNNLLFLVVYKELQIHLEFAVCKAALDLLYKFRLFAFLLGKRGAPNSFNQFTCHIYSSYKPFF